jgi:hypothetical protein
MITIRQVLILFCIFILILGCGTKKQAKSILLPQENGETGKIVVRSDTSGIMLDKPYTEAVYHAATGGFTTRQADPEETGQIYGPLLAAEPDMPDSADLAPGSRTNVPIIQEMIRQP